MGKHASHERGGRLPPAAGAAVAGATASAAMACGAILLWGVLPDARASLALVALPLVLMPFAVAAVTWVAAHRAIRASLEPAIESVERLAAQELATPTALAAAAETAGLALALERCRIALTERQRAMKVHAAVARLMGAAISRLAEGDLSARISVELPQPYQSFRDDFNAAMEALQKPSHETGERLRKRAEEIAEAAEQLGRRAARLAERIEADLAGTEAEGGDAPENLRVARHTLGGAGIAARRNMEAADRFTALARQVAEEADRLDGRAPEQEAPPAPEPAPVVHMPAADVPALKLASNS